MKQGNLSLFSVSTKSTTLLLWKSSVCSELLLIRTNAEEIQCKSSYEARGRMISVVIKQDMILNSRTLTASLFSTLVCEFLCWRHSVSLGTWPSSLSSSSSWLCVSDSAASEWRGLIMFADMSSWGDSVLRIVRVLSHVFWSVNLFHRFLCTEHLSSRLFSLKLPLCPRFDSPLFHLSSHPFTPSQALSPAWALLSWLHAGTHTDPSSLRTVYSLYFKLMWQTHTFRISSLTKTNVEIVSIVLNST